MEEQPTQSPEPLLLVAREPFVVEPSSRSIFSEQLIALLGTLFVVALVVGVGVSRWGQVAQEEVVAYVPPVIEVPSVVKPTQENPFSSVAVEARAAIVYDVYEDKILYAKQADVTLPLASLTKIMTSLLATETLDTNTHIAVSQNAIDTEGDSGLLANERWRLKDLVSFMMVSSSNDGADALAAAVGGLWQSTPETISEYEKVDSFVTKMNTRAKDLGLTDMKFTNPTGLDEPNGDDGGRGSAKDVATLLTYVWEHAPDAIRYTDEGARTFTSTDGHAHVAENTNEYVQSVPGIIASKTGFTDKAGGNLAVLYNAGLDHPIVIVVLGSSREGRFEDVQTLVNTTYKYVETGWYQFEVAGSTDRG